MPLTFMFCRENLLNDFAVELQGIEGLGQNSFDQTSSLNHEDSDDGISNLDLNDDVKERFHISQRSMHVALTQYQEALNSIKTLQQDYEDL